MDKETRKEQRDAYYAPMDAQEFVMLVSDHERVISKMTREMKVLTEKVEKLEKQHTSDTSLVDKMRDMMNAAVNPTHFHAPTQVEPDKITTEVPKFPSYYSKDDILIPSIPSEPDTEQVDREIAASIQWLADEYVLPKNRDEFVDDALDVAEKIRNLLKGQS